MAGAENVGCAAHARPTVCPSVASRNPLLYQSLPIIIPFRYALLRRRKDDTGVGTAARGIVERLRRFPRCVRPHGGRATRLRGRIVKIFKLAPLLEVTLLPTTALRLFFRS